MRNNPLAFIDPTGTELKLAADATKQDEKDYTGASKYVSKDGGEKAIVNTLRESDELYTVSIIHDGEDRFDPRTNTIFRDPRSALPTQDDEGKLNGGTQTPALGLAHELDHAAGKEEGTTALGEAPGYGDAAHRGAEEGRVITGSEAAAAGTLHEGTRTNHGRAPYESKGPMSWASHTRL